MELSKDEITRVKNTVPLLEEAGVAVSEYFYKSMFEKNAELKNIFNLSNQASGRQQFALFNIVVAYAKNLENLDKLSNDVERTAHKHTSLNVAPEHYKVVGYHIIETLRHFLGDAFSKETEKAWLKAYLQLADIFINREEQIYSSSENKTGGWKGTRDFVVLEKEIESKLVTSFYLAPVDKGPIADYRPGQYIGIELKPQTSDYTEVRQYSLSDAANQSSYRISVKRESEPNEGIVSNYLHDSIHVGSHVKLTPPTGDFFLQETHKPIVLISAGVGITPMMAMLEHLHKQNHSESVTFLHACDNEKQHSFQDRVKTICLKHKWEHHTWYWESSIQNSHVHTGLMNFNDIQRPLSDSIYYLCGPLGFMKFAKDSLSDLGVKEQNIHYEIFGPFAEL
ncbi:NO-inducible flavohemoprotein [Agaribacterium sp. ZY112]|uniref:NO-inducible flavohemoprotein n=1 Tax=Agaribacterium sp. ZY112 TaxID=3233574 RepID=UPI00352548A0